MDRARLLLVLALASCARQPTPSAPPLRIGTPDALGHAEDLAYDALFSDDEGPVARKGVDALRTLRVRADEATGMTHTHVRQLYRGIPVWGGEAIVHLTPQGKLASVTDDLLSGVRVDPTPDYTADEAIELAVDRYAGGWEALTDDPTADLWVFRRDGTDHLVWRVLLEQLDGSSADAIPVLFVDAHTGELVWSYDDLQTVTCTGATPHYGTVSFDCALSSGSWYLEDTGDLLGTYSWNNTTSGLYHVSSTSSTFGSSTATKNAVEAHYVAEQVNDYYATELGRDGIDGAGGPAVVTSHGRSFVASTTSYSSSYTNAYWSTSSRMMVYGDGDGSSFGSLTTLDIGGHEQTHGVTQYEANLTYSGESGALNESMSDVFGAMVERHVRGESANTWRIAEDAYTPGTSGDALRYMSDPAADGRSLDYYSSSVASTDVHYGSGVGNLAFYLLAKGGSHPRHRSTTVVTGIGADAAADIWYLALTDYMTSSTTYSGARTATLSAAAALYGASSSEYRAVGDAWTAVGVTGSSSSSTSCSTTTASGSISSTHGTSYQTSTSGVTVSAATQTAVLAGPVTADFDLYLQKLSGSTWSTVATAAGSTSAELLTYSGSAGTYRMRVYASRGSGSYSLVWCR